MNGKDIRFAFNNGYLLIVIDTKNQYSAGPMFKPLTDAGRTQRILDEISVIYDVIDSVVAQKRPSWIDQKLREYSQEVFAVIAVWGARLNRVIW